MTKIKALIEKALSLQPIRYGISSVIAFVIDYTILLVVEWLLGDFSLAMEVAAVAAFCVSSQVNFHINRRWVFRSEKSMWAEMGGYYALAAVSFTIKTFVLMEVMTRVFLFPTWLAKSIAEVIMFVINFAVQKLLIFRKKKTEEK
ncbi:MAG: GtrA family protein [Oscillospiraceae bacterium]|nr:GtrA family protein [Oscillospiraceae bacterium]